MALLSPGVQVSVTDESFSTGAGPGTVPLVLIATKQDKTTPDGTATAVGTTAANANNLYLISSQRELLQTFGNPDFNEVGGSAQNGYPLNEYGLLAAYSYLGLANRAYVIRADIDLSELDPLTVAPAGDPLDNTYWVDLNEFTPGLFVSDASGNWNEVAVTTVVYGSQQFSESTDIAGYAVGDVIAVWYPNGVNIAPAGASGSDAGHHLEFFVLGTDGLWDKIVNAYWAPHYNVPTSGGANEYWVKTTTPNSGLSINVKRFDATLGQFVDLGITPVFGTTTDYYGQASISAATVPAGTIVGFVDNTDTLVATQGADLDVVLRQHSGAATNVATGTAVIQFGNITAATVLEITINNNPTSVDVEFAGTETTIDQIVTVINIDAEVQADGRIVAGKTTDSAGNDLLVLTINSGEDVTLAVSGAGTLSDFGFVTSDPTITYSNFTDLDAVTGNTYVASLTQPTGSTPYGTYWYDPSFTVDLLVKNADGTWWDIADADFFVQADEPASPANGDYWVETDTGVNYPVIYRGDTTTSSWIQVDNSDQTTPLGIIFADARDASQVPAVKSNATATGTLDDDAPDPALYPAGTLLWNTRASGRNVKIWTEDATTAAAPLSTRDRWVSASGNATDGSLIAGAAAQKAIVVQAIASTLTSNEDIRNDTIFYNLVAAPGFPELIDEMLALNVDRKEQAFVVGDSPFSLSSATTDLQNWASNANNATGNGDDGLVTADPYLGVYYPSGLSTNVDGSEVVVPASHMVLRQLAFNDQVAYPWFAPAGFARGTISNASAVGYLDSEDEFVTVTLNEGQRDTLYTNNVNPIATLPGRGIVIWGQKTRNATAGALDRVNVARLVNYIRYQADVLAQPFLFEPNDTVTRDAVKDAFDSFLAELVTLRGVTDFLVVVDESNNTPARIDRNELWVDIAIQPTRAVEFIYIPIRLRNTGDDLQPGA